MKLKTSKEIDKILETIEKIYPDAKTELNYETHFQFLIAIIMSAQTTDKQVNQVTKELFKIIKEPKDVDKLEISQIEKIVGSINYYKNKAKFIKKAGEKIVVDFNSEVPRDIMSLQTIPGVGIKTAKVYLSVIYDLPYVAVDTHVHRVCNRLGIVSSKLPEETDKKLEKNLTQDQKLKMHHIFILFGRYFCKAIKPKCSECVVIEMCGYTNKKL